MSRELQEFLTSKGIAGSRTTSNNPQGNGQVERTNGTIWKAITAALKSRGLPIKYWQIVLHDALHSIRSLLCTTTNATPHERLFNYTRRSSTGTSVPSWLCGPGSVLLKRHVRMSKTEPLVDEIELLHANPLYALIKYPNGKVDSVSIRHIAPVDSEPNCVQLSQEINDHIPQCPESTEPTQEYASGPVQEGVGDSSRKPSSALPPQHETSERGSCT